MLHISIQAETLFHIFGFPVTNSYLASIIVLILFAGLCLHFYKQTKLPTEKRSVLFFLLKYANISLHNFFKSIIGEKINPFFTFLAALFIYILLQNWFGLIPGVGSILIDDLPLFRGATADLNTTIALGILGMITVQYFGIKVLGFRKYAQKFINLSNPIAFFTGILEIVSEFSRVMSFSFRLFGNIFAGEVLIAVIAFLVPILASFPFLLLEIFVGLVQALVFTMLISVFINLAISEHH